MCFSKNKIKISNKQYYFKGKLFFYLNIYILAVKQTICNVKLYTSLREKKLKLYNAKCKLLQILILFE